MNFNELSTFFHLCLLASLVCGISGLWLRPGNCSIGQNFWLP